MHVYVVFLWSRYAEQKKALSFREDPEGLARDLKMHPYQRAAVQWMHSVESDAARGMCVSNLCLGARMSSVNSHAYLDIEDVSDIARR